jgi:hypothetical protein
MLVHIIEYVQIQFCKPCRYIEVSHPPLANAARSTPPNHENIYQKPMDLTLSQHV